MGKASVINTLQVFEELLNFGFSEFLLSCCHAVGAGQSHAVNAGDNHAVDADYGKLY